MSEKNPFFPLYPADFLVSTAHWTNAEVGAYFRLLCHQWANGKVPADTRRIANIVGVHGEEFDQMWSVVGPKFASDGNGGLMNERMEKVREQVVERSEKARKAADKRWSSNANADADAYAKPDAKPMRSKSKSKSNTKTKDKDSKQHCAADKISDTDVREVFDRHLIARTKYFERKNGKSPSSLPDLTPELRRAIRDAIRRHGLEKAKAAGVGIFYSPFHTGDNEHGREYLQPHLCWRIQTGKAHDTNNVERFAELALEREARYSVAS